MNRTIEYKIDHDGRIVDVNDAWDSFAILNDTPQLEASKVVGRRIWDFITDETVKQIYREMLERVRAGNEAVFEYRCDAPQERRYMQMRISETDDAIVFRSITLGTQMRPHAKLLEPGGAEARGLVTSCSWCNKIRTGDGQWAEVEVAVQKLGIFEHQEVPRLSHGACADCIRAIRESMAATAKSPDGLAEPVS